MKDEIIIIKYPSNLSEMLLKVIVFLLITIFIGYAVFKAQNENLITLISLVIFFIAGIWGTFSYIHRIYSYDEIYINDKYFIVKKKNKIISKNKIENLEITSFRAWFEIFGVYQISIRMNNKLIFYYLTNEIEKLENEKLVNKLKSEAKLWQYK